MTESNPLLIQSLYKFWSRWLRQIHFWFSHCKNSKKSSDGVKSTFDSITVQILKSMTTPDPLLV